MKKYLIYAKKAGIYLQNLGDACREEWTSNKKEAKEFTSMKEVQQTMKALNGISFCKKPGDCVVVPLPEIEGKKKMEMQDYKVAIYHALGFWREELIEAYDPIDAFNETFVRHMNTGRNVIHIEVKLRPKKIRTPEQHDNIRCEKSL
jgi:hypothetical protein